MTPEEQLEKFIDNHNLKYVLEQIAYICHEKADHVRSNWQDRELANTWDQDGYRIDHILDKIKN